MKSLAQGGNRTQVCLTGTAVLCQGPCSHLTGPNWSSCGKQEADQRENPAHLRPSLAYLTANPRHNKVFIHKYFSLYSTDFFEKI